MKLHHVPHVTQAKYRRQGRCPQCGGARPDELVYCPPCRLSKNRNRHRHFDKVLKQTLEAYSGNRFGCCCCGEADSGFLTLDHIIGTGHRGLGSGINFYATLRRQGWPMRDELRVMCFNCNCGRQVNGGTCPHHGLKEPATDGEKRNRRIKTQTIEAYGGACFCCDEHNLGFLTLDHVKSKRTDRLTGVGWYFDLQTKGWPDVGVTVACFNCNCGRQFRGKGVCPHKGRA